MQDKVLCPAWWPGGDLLSRALRRSTMGAGVFHGRVRDGIGCSNPAMATGPPSRTRLVCIDGCDLDGDIGCFVCECGLMLRAVSVLLPTASD